MNSAKIESIMNQAASLQKAKQSAFWNKVGVMQKITYTAQKLINSLSTQRLMMWL